MSVIRDCFPGEIMRYQAEVLSDVGRAYRVDLLFPEHNIVVECDENGHAAYDIEGEEERTNTIISKLQGPSIIRFNPDSPTFNIHKVVGRIFQEIRASLVKQ